ncbi:MAG TPA: hypothetical protein VE377_24040 [Candidatus Dormibacteraeota bacterium]|nr:hypothetical protein [Candidatus Dormibacteraeota bacterium]
MKTGIWGVLASVVLVPGMLLAQESASASKQENSPAAKPLVVSGRVSSDGKTLMTDIDSEWKVSNADALKGYEGRLVRVRCYVDSKADRIEILSVKKDDGQLTYAARHADSAFRR